MRGLQVLRAVVEALRSYGANITDPAKGDPKVNTKIAREVK